MASRLTAVTILIAGMAALVWVLLGAGSDTTEVVSSPAPASTSTDTTAPSPASASSADTQSGDTQTGDTQTADTPDAPATDDSEAPTVEPTPEPTIEAPENFGPRMDLVELDGWLNTDATSIDDFNGQVVLVEMWTFGCHNCKARIPYNQSYREEFGDQNFEIVGVHAPEFSYEAEVPNIVEAAANLGVDWPIALDTNKKNFRAWQPGSTNFWPRTYVIDQNGDIRYDHIGEGKYEELRETIRYLVENPPPPKTQ